jgi:hypothetical protein
MNVENTVSAKSLLAVLAVQCHVLSVHDLAFQHYGKQLCKLYFFVCFDFVSETYSVPSRIFASALRCIFLARTVSWAAVRPSQ